VSVRASRSAQSPVGVLRIVDGSVGGERFDAGSYQEVLIEDDRIVKGGAKALDNCWRSKVERGLGG